MAEPKVIDVTGLVLGRVSSLIAKRLLAGDDIIIINAEKVLVLGGRQNILKSYEAAHARGSVRKGPNFPRSPERIMRRSVRGMLPYHRSTGREAYKHLKAYIGVPDEYATVKAERLEEAAARPSLSEPLTLLEISRHLGAKV